MVTRVSPCKARCAFWGNNVFLLLSTHLLGTARAPLAFLKKKQKRNRETKLISTLLKKVWSPEVAVHWASGHWRRPGGLSAGTRTRTAYHQQADALGWFWVLVWTMLMISRGWNCATNGSASPELHTMTKSSTKCLLWATFSKNTFVGIYK